MSEIRFKVAEEPREREQVHRLHYQAFVEEIPQYVRNEERRLVDRFDDQNTYIVALNGDVVVAASPYAESGRSRSIRNCRISTTTCPPDTGSARFDC